MSREADFDAFYRSTRSALTQQALALTGDPVAARRGVREAYVAAWHHWRKVAARQDPLDWVRPRAWRQARRRRRARLLARAPELPEPDARVISALAPLPVLQRRLLLLSRLAEVSLTRAAREVGVPREVAERHVESACDHVAGTLGIAPEDLTRQLARLGTTGEDIRMPRGSIIRRAGGKRRRSHAVLAAVAVTATAVGSGAVVYQPRVVTGEDASATALPGTARSTPAATLPDAQDLLDAHDVARLGPHRRWRLLGTHDGAPGSGLGASCRQERFADPDGLSVLARRFRTADSPHRSAVQTVTTSRSPARAEQAFSTTVGWYAGCDTARTQLLRTYRVDGVGDEATVVVLRRWAKPATTYAVAVARVGPMVTSTVDATVGTSRPPMGRVAGSLADAATGLCAAQGRGGCPGSPHYTRVPPIPTGTAPGLLEVVDLPPVGNVDEPWVGTRVRHTDGPRSATCDHTDLGRAGAVRARSRTYLIPGARLPKRFGLSERYGVFASRHAAARVVDRLRHRVDRCEKRDLATEVHHPHTRTGARPRSETFSWTQSTAVSKQETVRFRLGIVRVGDTVATVSLTPCAGGDVSTHRFAFLLRRAASRLGELA